MIVQSFEAAGSNVEDPVLTNRRTFPRRCLSHSEAAYRREMSLFRRSTGVGSFLPVIMQRQLFSRL